MPKKTIAKPRKVGSAARHEVNRGEVDPWKLRIIELERVVKALCRRFDFKPE
jgi:hypothetical protein